MKTKDSQFGISNSQKNSAHLPTLFPKEITTISGSPHINVGFRQNVTLI
jgi:hypothetical protein